MFRSDEWVSYIIAFRIGFKVGAMFGKTNVRSFRYGILFNGENELCCVNKKWYFKVIILK